MDFLMDSVRRHLSGSRNKSRSLPLYTKGPGSGPEPPSCSGPLQGNQQQQQQLQKRISSSSPRLSWNPQHQDRRLQSKRRNSSSCLPTPGQQSDSDGSNSDTTSCSSMEFLPGSSFKPPIQESPDQASRTSSNRRERLEALKARVTAQRNKYKNDSSSSSSSSEGEEEEKPGETGVPGRISRFHSDEALHRPGRGRASRRTKRRSQDLEALSRTQVTRSDPQLPYEDRPQVSWKESSAYLEPLKLQPEDSPWQSASEDIPIPKLVPKPATVPPPLSARSAVRKPLTVSVHGLAGHFPPASPCDSGLGSHSMTSSPSLGRAPTPPLRVTARSDVPRLPPSLSSGQQSEPSIAVWWRRKQGTPNLQANSNRTEIASPRPVGRVYSYNDQAPRPSAYLSDSQVEHGKNHSEQFSRRLGAWKAMESATVKTQEEHQKPDDGEGELLMDTCRARNVSWPKDFSNGVSRSPIFDSSARSSPLVWAKKETPNGSSGRSFTPVPVRSEVSTTSTPKSSPVPPRLWSPPVQTRNPNRISAAEALGVTAAIPLPPTRVGSLETARRSVDVLAEKERRRRCSEHLEDALQELETIYQSLRLNEDDELLDRAERRDMPEWRPAGSGPHWRKRYSIADPTGGFPLVRSFSDSPSRLRRSAVPDRVADDFAVRKLQQRPSEPRNKLSADTVPSYLLYSPAHTPSLSVQPATRDVTSTNEPDPELDDVGYRKFTQSCRYLPPHPPFGIPLDPSPGTPASSYIYAENASDVERTPDWRSSKKNVQPDPLRDDLAYRNLRRESLLRAGSRRSVSALSDLEDFTRPHPMQEQDSMASIIAALEDLGQKSPPPVPKRRSVPSSGQKRLHGLTLRA